VRAELLAHLPPVRGRLRAQVPLAPREIASQNTSRPTPNGDTTPMPVIATRGRVILFSG